MTTANANDFELIESVANKLPAAAKEDFRTLMQGWSGQLQTLNTSTGNTPAGNTANVVVPAAPGLSVAGANGAFTLTITPPALTVQATLWYEISYSTVKGFTSGVTTLEPSTSTSMTLNMPGETLFFRVRASLNKSAWSAYALASQTAAASGLVSSSATSNGGAFNQTNYGIVTSSDVGGAAVVEIQGAGGSLTSMVAVKGGAESTQPAAAIANVPLGSSQFVGYQAESGTYTLKPTLAAVLADGNTPVGKVSVVDSGVVTLPVLTPILSGGYLVGASFTPGSGLSAVPTFTVVPGGAGVDAVIIGTGVTAGELTGVQVLNPGNGHYDGSTTITAAGGIFPGTAGGGTAAGGNGGRLTAV